MEKIVIRIFMLFCLVFASVGTRADYPQKESDFAALPPYCKAKLFYGNKSSQYKTWEQRIGKETFIHVHHYCSALFSIDLAYKRNDQRASLLRNALANIGYMEKQAPMSSPLMPEMLVKKGRVLQMQGRAPEAMMAFHQSITLKKTYSPAYMAIADYYISTGQYDEALETTEKGLKLVPKSKGLKRRKDKISSKMPVTDHAAASDSAGRSQKAE